MQDIFPPNNAHHFDESLRLISTCPVCRHAYGPYEATIIDEHDANHLMYLKCQQCQSAIIALVMASQVGLSSIGIMTDLESDEVDQAGAQGQISEDDVLRLVGALAEKPAAFLA